MTHDKCNVDLDCPCIYSYLCNVTSPMFAEPRHFEHDDIEYIANAEGALWCSDEHGALILRIGG